MRPKVASGAKPHLVLPVVLGILLASALAVTSASTAAQNEQDQPSPALDLQETHEVMAWIAKQVASARQPYCYRDSYGRGVGRPLTTCASSEEKDGALCYPKCEPGYNGVGPVCWQDCPSGFTDIGVSCAKPSAYGRGAGHPWKIGDRAFSLDPKCTPGFHSVGCCICSPDCINGMRDDGALCAKKSYGCGVGTPFDCAGGLAQDGALCYPPCKSGFHGVGPICWQDCPAGKVACGAGCAESGTTCATQTTSMVTSPVMLAANIATAGSSSTMTKSYGKIIDTVKDLYTSNKHLIDAGRYLYKAAYQAGTKGHQLGEAVGLWVADYVGVFSRMTTPKVESEIAKHFSPEAADWVRQQYALHHLSLMMEADGMDFAQGVLGAVTVFDPSGVSDVVAAYTHPICELDEAFPTVSAAY
jgi:hypothetical protein